MQGLSTLSQQLANTAGTAFAPQSATQLQQYSTQLKQSDDPQFQRSGALYTQEAQALQAGNIQGADQAANQVAAVPQPYVAPGYQPTQNESALALSFNQVIGTVIASLGGILGTLAVSQILQALGIPNLSSLLGDGTGNWDIPWVRTERRTRLLPTRERTPSRPGEALSSSNWEAST